MRSSGDEEVHVDVQERTDCPARRMVARSAVRLDGRRVDPSVVVSESLSYFRARLVSIQLSTHSRLRSAGFWHTTGYEHSDHYGTNDGASDRAILCLVDQAGWIQSAAWEPRIWINNT